MPFNILVAVCLAYVMVLFGVAFFAERRARGGRLGWLGTPMVYTLSLSIYCTAWTFYGAVGYAARSGLEFATIYLGPTLVFVGWWWGLRKLVRIGRAQRVTSIADLISARYGKSNTLGVVVTLMAVVASTPYIALQLQSVTLSFGVFAAALPIGAALPDQGAVALWLAGGLALFTILFGTRNLDANERHHGVVMAIALEAVVKVVALLAVGSFVVWGMADGVADVLGRIGTSKIAEWPLNPGRWGGLIFVSAAAVITLPRMFQVLVVENVDERHLATAGWAFPLYLMAMSLFVVPIAVVGLEVMPAGANRPCQVVTTKPGTSASSSVRKSGSEAMRFLPVTASARMRPSRTCGTAVSTAASRPRPMIANRSTGRAIDQPFSAARIAASSSASMMVWLMGRWPLAWVRKRKSGWRRGAGCGSASGLDDCRCR